MSAQTIDIRTRSSQEAAAREQELIALISELVRELHAQGGGRMDVSLASRLDRDLGIDSLGRTELILRIEHAFRVRLPPETLSEAETVGDLLTALGQAAPHVRQARDVTPIAAPAPTVSAPSRARTLLDVLEWHVAQHPDRMHVTVLEDESTVVGAMTYAQLADAARKVAAALIVRDVVPGDRIALMLPTSLDFFASFFGILYAGAVPVPIYPPARLSQLEEHMHRQAGILRNAEARILITVPQALRLASFLRGQVPSLSAVESAAGLTAQSSPCQLPLISGGEATAFIQYTSGSTGDPKGVVFSHANLLANIRAIGIAVNATSADVFVSWLPLYHDFGLIGAWLGSLYFAASFYVMSPLSFLRRPESWLWAIHRYRATLSAAPNFAYELCFTKIDPEDVEGFDLSSLRMVANGAEPVSVQTLRRFTSDFRTLRLQGGSDGACLWTCREHPGTHISTARPGAARRSGRTATRSAGAPSQSRRARTMRRRSKSSPAASRFPAHEVRIVDEVGRDLADRHEGRVGVSRTVGHVRLFPQRSQDARAVPRWLARQWRPRLHGGRRGLRYRSHQGHDHSRRPPSSIRRKSRRPSADIPGIIKHGVAVFGTSDPSSGTERTVILAETSEG